MPETETTATGMASEAIRALDDCCATLKLLREITDLRAALEPFAHFARQWERRPIRGLSDDLYVIHAGEYEAALRLSDCQRARDLLGPA